jgi:hypothetical protein
MRKRTQAAHQPPLLQPITRRARAARARPWALTRWALTRWALTLCALTALALSVTACELGGADCTGAATEYQSLVTVEGALNNELPMDGPYPMALVISQDAINRLFAAIASANLPPITLRDSILGVNVGVTIRPSLPLIEIGQALECPTCILTSMNLGLDFLVGSNTVPAVGMARYAFPLNMRANGLDSTKVLGAFNESRFLNLTVQLQPGSLGGIESLVNQAVALFEPQIANYVTGLVRNDLGERELFQLDAWEIGDGEVKLLGRGPIISPEHKTIVIGMHSNLVRPANGTVNALPSLPEGADIGLQFHPELIQTMIQRMMHEGHIDRSYDSTGNPSSGGQTQVTLSSLAPSSASADLMTTSFALWRTSGGFCGAANLQADLGLSISDKQLRFSAQNVQITGGSGTFGSVASVLGRGLQSSLIANAINTAQITVNYNELKLPGDKRADMSAESFRLSLDGEGLRLFLNIDAIVDAVVN